MTLTISEGANVTCPWCGKPVDRSKSHHYLRRRYFHWRCGLEVCG